MNRGFTAGSSERIERCSRHTTDVPRVTSISLIQTYAKEYKAQQHAHESTTGWFTCHGTEGKTNPTSIQLSCKVCHIESVVHKAFSLVH